MMALAANIDSSSCPEQQALGFGSPSRVPAITEYLLQTSYIYIYLYRYRYLLKE
jgi:hypothetical protein